MKRLEIEPGHRFGDWVVAAELPPCAGHRYFRVRCTARARVIEHECGDEIEAELNNLKAAKVKCFRCKPVKKDTYYAISLQRIGLLVPLGLTGEGRGDSALWMCVCTRCKRLCVKDTATLLRHQRRGRSFLNCGCLRAPRRITHGMSQTREYQIWQGIKYRCTNPNSPNYEKYSKRGICDEWRKSFQNFWDDLGTCPEGYSLERADNDGQYNKTNCHWAPIAEQNRNKGNNRRVSYKGEIFVLADFADVIGLTRQKVSQMLDENWTPEEIAAAAVYDNHQTAYMVTENRAEFEALI